MREILVLSQDKNKNVASQGKHNGNGGAYREVVENGNKGREEIIRKAKAQESQKESSENE